MTTLIQISVPAPYASTELHETFNRHRAVFQNSDVRVREMLWNHYKWLLELTSLQYKIHWVVNSDIVQLDFPELVAFDKMDLRKDVQAFHDDAPVFDRLSEMLGMVVSDVPMERVLSHFQVAKHK